MKNAETATEKLLSLKKMLEGFGSVFNPDGSTIFSLHLAANHIAFGQLVWMRNNLPTWAKLLNEKSGARVVSLSVEEKEKYEREIMAQISLVMVINGEIDVRNVRDREVADMFSGQIKKMLAMRIEKNLPPPFNFKHNLEERLFAPDLDDTYLVYSSCHYRELTEEMIEKLFSSETKTDADALAQNLGARLVMVKEKAERLRGLDYHYFVIQWLEAANGSERFHFAIELYKLLDKKGIRCSVRRYEESLEHH